MMSVLLAVARTAPASKDGVQLGGVKRPSVLTFWIAREPAQTSGAVEEPGRRRAPTRPADGKRRDERAVRCRVLLHQVLQGFRHPMDGMGWQDLKGPRQLLVGDGGLALRDVFEECAHPCMRRHPIVPSPKLGVTSGMVTSSHRREWASIEMRTSLPAYPAGTERRYGAGGEEWQLCRCM